tara:strand:- start:1046 stop:1912 length:867 start_codon:yes stop_codon:yes gene_type:complete
MIVARTIDQVRDARLNLKEPVGLVPTMGALHRGHLALLKTARRSDQSVIATLFVNRSQFGNPEDFSAYPRDEEADLAAFEAAGVDLVFMPTEAELYPKGITATVHPGRIAHDLEGTRRPGHFAGVATVVAKIFGLTQPHRAYFGQKDWQQTRVIAEMVANLNIPLTLTVIGTVRDSDGIALSSRNVRLTSRERGAATSLYRGLTSAREAWDAGTHAPTSLAEIVSNVISQEPLATTAYVEVRHALTLTPLSKTIPPFVIAGAIEIGGIGLIDNIVVGNALTLAEELNG